MAKKVVKKTSKKEKSLAVIKKHPFYVILVSLVLAFFNAWVLKLFIGIFGMQVTYMSTFIVALVYSVIRVMPILASKEGHLKKMNNLGWYIGMLVGFVMLILYLNVSWPKSLLLMLIFIVVDFILIILAEILIVVGYMLYVQYKVKKSFQKIDKL